MKNLKFEHWHYVFLSVAIFFTVVVILAYTNNPLLSWGWEGTLYDRFYNYTSAGQKPFIDFFIEYPPISAYFIALPALFNRNLNHLEYLASFAFITSTIALFIPIFNQWTTNNIIYTTESNLAKVSTDIERVGEKSELIEKQSEGDKKIIFPEVLKDTRSILNKSLDWWNSIYLILLIPSFTLINTRYDIFPSVMTFVAICLYILDLRKSNKVYLVFAYLLISIATFSKIYPILILLIFLLLDLWRGKWKNILISGLIFVISLLPTLYFSYFGQVRFENFINYQTASRDLQIESIWASVAFGLEKLKLVEPSIIIIQNGAQELVNNYAKDIAKLNLYILALIFIVAFSILLVRFRIFKVSKLGLKVRAPRNNELMLVTILGSLFAVTTFLLFNKVMSPQYLVWILGLLPLLTYLEYSKNKVKLIALGWALIMFLTLFLYPIDYTGLVERQTFKVVILLLRNILLFIWWGWLFSELWNLKPATLHKTEAELPLNI